MRFLILFVLFFATPVQAKAWNPPKSPNPFTILSDAQKDTRAGRFEAALAKYLWYHDYALQYDYAFDIDPTQNKVKRKFRGAVWLSSALPQWVKLGKRYPPALEKLKETRDAARQKVLAGEDLRTAFYDMAAINESLNSESKTKEVFEELDQNDEQNAKDVFWFARPSLINGKAYELVGKYVSPEKELRAISRMFNSAEASAMRARGLLRPLKSLSQDERDENGGYHFGKLQLIPSYRIYTENDQRMGYLLKSVEETFEHRAATLVAILALSNRKEEAEEIATAAAAQWDDKKFKASLKKALDGVIPKPIPLLGRRTIQTIYPVIRPPVIPPPVIPNPKSL